MKLKIENELSMNNIKALYTDAAYNWSNNVDNSIDLTDIYIVDNGERLASYSIVLTKVKRCDEIFMKLVDNNGNRKGIHEITCVGDAQLSYMHMINTAKHKLKKKYLSNKV